MARLSDIVVRLLDNAPAGIAVLRGPNHVFEVANPRYLTLVSRTAADVLGKPLREALPEVEAQGFVGLLDGVLRTGTEYVGHEVEVVLADVKTRVQRTVYVDFVYQPMFGDTGAVEGIFVHVNEVTAQVNARREIEELARQLRVQRDHLQQVIDALPEGIAIGDASGAIIQSNQEARRIWGQPEVAGGVQEYVEYGLWSIDGIPLKPEQIAYSRSLLNGETVRGEQMLVGNKATGGRIPILQNSTPLRDDDGSITGAVIAFQDISRLKELERQKDEFLGLVSHELRTPLTTILGNADILLRYAGRLDAEVLAASHRDIHKEAERLYAIVENMLALSRVESRPDVELEPVLLERLLRSAVEDHRRRFFTRQITLAGRANGTVVEASPTYILQVVNNLLGNAEKYSPPDAPIDVVLTCEDGSLTTRVLDRGSGVPMNEHRSIFESFYRSEGATQQAVGMGLGLAVCKRLIEVQNGEIWCLPRVGGGTEFGFRLPASTG